MNAAGFFDPYTLKARIGPWFVTLLPVGLAVISWFPAEKDLWSLPAVAASMIVLALVFSQIGRDAGRRRERSLFRTGGKPTTNALSYQTSWLNPASLDRHHHKLAAILPHIAIPLTPEEETRDLGAAGTAYDSCVDYLRERTRDHALFPLVFEENVNYGTRRNLWALKVLGILLCGFSIVACGLRVWYLVAEGRALEVSVLLAGIVNLFLIAVWAIVVRERWVREAGNRYAERLLGTAETIEYPPSPLGS